MENNLKKVVETLDKQILEEKDLYILRALFDIKLSVSAILPGIKTIHYDPSFLLENESLDFNLVCEILMKVAQVCDDVNNLLKNIFKYIIKNHGKVEYQLNIVKLLSYSITISMKYDRVDKLFENLNPEFVYEFLISALDTRIKPMPFETLASYFKLFSKTHQIKCLNSVFSYSSKNKNFEVFCALLNYTHKDPMYSADSCLSTDDAWLCLESCISGPESYLQKQAGYILSKFLANLESNHALTHLTVSNDNVDSWQAFFILIDMGREKQLHLVAPSLNLFKYIYNLPFLWQKCVYKIYLEHSQSTIVYKVAIKVLKKEYSEDNLKEIIKLLFQAINKNEYSELSCDMFKTLSTFCAGLSKTKLDIVIKESLNISWNAVSFWKIIQSIFVCDNIINNVEIELLQEVIRYAGNLPHVFIRTECIKYLINIFWDEKDYNKILKISCSLSLSDIIKYQYFESCKFSDGIVSSIVTDLLQFDTDLKIIKICFMILNNLNIDAWWYFKKELNTLNPHVLLFLWSEYLLSDGQVEKYEQIGAFLYKYFKQYLHEETIDIFIVTLKSLSSKYLLAADTILRLVNETLFAPEKYSENQTYVALVLIKDLLKPSCNDIKMSVKGHAGSVVICFFLEDDRIVKEIMVKESRISTVCTDLIFKLHKNYSATDLIDIFTNLSQSQDNKFLFDFYKKLLLLSDRSDLVVNLIEVCHQNLLQIKRDQYFKRIICEFIKVVYSELYLKHGIANVIFISRIVRQLSEAYPIVRFNWTKALEVLCKVGSAYYEVCLGPIVDIYLQGEIITKDERTEFNLCQEFLCNIDHESKEPCHFVLGENSNPNLLTAASRLLALEVLLMIAKRDAELVFSCLKEKYMQHFKKRYFPDSKIHYEKLRIVQAVLMLVLVLELSEDQTNRISSFVFNCLQEETNQNCVKQLFNWILILVLKEAAPVIEWIESRATTISPSILISVMPAVYHLTLFGNEEVFEKTLAMALPWTMGAQFKLRVYAQDLIRRILEHARRRNYAKFINQYNHLENSLISCIEATGDIFVSTMKSDLTFITDFDPIRDKSLATLVYDVPRLNKVYPTEWQNMRFFISNPALLEANEIYLPQQKNSSFTDAVDRFLTEDKSKVSQEDSLLNPILNIQKKITPWKSTLESVHDADAKAKTDFILIASLIDKSQNLGGLSRTCEVFGIRNITFKDAKIIEEKEFKSLSMSSEFWINASEVKAKDLEEYILKLQKDGYSVVGAEQTAGSQKVNEFQFPRKMALLLGNEKTGIPPNLIPLLNICLEIPQFGQTRSLNVHVAGALFIWEYAKQHLV